MTTGGGGGGAVVVGVGVGVGRRTGGGGATVRGGDVLGLAVGVEGGRGDVPGALGAVDSPEPGFTGTVPPLRVGAFVESLPVVASASGSMVSLGVGVGLLVPNGTGVRISLNRTVSPVSVPSVRDSSDVLMYRATASAAADRTDGAILSAVVVTRLERVDGLSSPLLAVRAILGASQQ